MEYRDIPNLSTQITTITAARWLLAAGCYWQILVTAMHHKEISESLQLHLIRGRWGACRFEMGSTEDSSIAAEREVRAWVSTGHWTQSNMAILYIWHLPSSLDAPSRTQITGRIVTVFRRCQDGEQEHAVRPQTSEQASAAGIQRCTRGLRDEWKSGSARGLLGEVRLITAEATVLEDINVSVSHILSRISPGHDTGTSIRRCVDTRRVMRPSSQPETRVPEFQSSRRPSAGSRLEPWTWDMSNTGDAAADCKGTRLTTKKWQPCYKPR
ncbi:hypothetical protein G7Y89_g14500 [Cudoniella acicularis]|uniref:Uncharacterized protein n=1 Tax=Cudoniella acicularis TaxID=354080 RepID=A0A8H4VVD1_9HELO|nr:hypothetical protein G7Y89_g14500 [Cudoniella acicularis]